MRSAAERLGVPRMWWWRVESGRVVPGEKALRVLAESFGVEAGPMLAAAERQAGCWTIPMWDGAPWQAREFLSGLARGVSPDAEFWRKLGERLDYIKPKEEP